MQFNYFNENETDQYMFFRIPQLLFSEAIFKDISCESKVLYGFLLDRTSLSKKNNWVDKDNHIYVFFTIEEVMKKLNVATAKAVKLFAELENIGLIIRKKQGQGKAAKIYVMNFAKPFIAECSEPKNDMPADENLRLSVSETQTFENRKSEQKKPQSKVKTFENRKSEQKKPQSKVKTFENRKSKLLKNESLDFRKSKCNHTNRIILNEPSIIHSTSEQEKNETQNSQTPQTNERMNDITQDEYNDVVLSVKEQLGYEFLINNTSINRNTLNLIVDIVVSVYCMPEDKSLVINKNSVPVSVIKEKYCELEAEHISYVVECLENQSKTQTIRYLRKYLISSLFNAPDTIDAYYEAQVNLDMEKITG